MKNTFRGKTFKIAFCGVIAALGTVFMLLTSVIPIGTYAIPIFAGALLISAVIEFGVRWALGVYLVISILSALLAGDKEAVVFFIALFGYYPVLKNVFESKIKSKPAVILLKLLVFNISAVASFFFTTLVLKIPAEEYTVFGVYVPYVFLILGNIIFLLYDRALTVFVIFYVKVIAPKLFPGAKRNNFPPK